MKNIKIIILLAMAVSYMACNKCEEVVLEPCGVSNEKPLVDLIVLIDASGSMGRVADSISVAAQAAIDNAMASCNTDLRVSFLGVDGVWPGTVFDTATHRQYIYNETGIITLSADINHVGLPTEQGANAIEDLSIYAPWREGSCRAIFYISDEELDSFSPVGDFTNEDAATNDAILAAQANNVSVFTHYIMEQGRGPSILNNYDDITSQTGGINLTTPTYAAVNAQLYIDFMPTIVCNACNGCHLNQYK